MQVARAHGMRSYQRYFDGRLTSGDPTRMFGELISAITASSETTSSRSKTVALVVVFLLVLGIYLFYLPQ